MLKREILQYLVKRYRNGYQLVDPKYEGIKKHLLKSSDVMLEEGTRLTTIYNDLLDGYTCITAGLYRELLLGHADLLFEHLSRHHQY